MERFPINKKIGNYNILKEIGSSSSGIVYQGIDTKTNKILAIKIIPLNYFKDIKMQQTFQRTLHLLESLNHPNIINFLSKEKTKNNYYIIYEYVNGGNLKSFADNYIKKNKKPLDEKYIKMILKQISDGLYYLHSKNIIHRNIKLENFLIDFDDINNKQLEDGKFTIKIKNFALARELIEGAKTASICGSLTTMAPEVLMAKVENKYTINADLWSFGICAYELVTGNLPFKGKNNKEIFDNISKGQYCYNKNLNISIGCIKFIKGLLQFDPDKRFFWNEIKNNKFLNICKNICEDDDNKKLVLFMQNDYDNVNHFEINSKKNDNFLWKVYNNGNIIGISLDKLTNNNLDNVINYNYYNEKKDGKINLNINDGKLF